MVFFGVNISENYLSFVVRTNPVEFANKALEINGL